MMNLSKRLLAGLAVVIATPQNDQVMTLARRMARDRNVQTDARSSRFSQQEIKAAQDKILEKLRDRPQTLQSLGHLLPNLKPELIAQATSNLTDQGRAKTWGAGSTDEPYHYLEAKTFSSAAERIIAAVKSSGKGLSLEHMKAALPQINAQVLEGVATSLVEDARLSGPGKDHPTTYVIAPASS